MTKGEMLQITKQMNHDAHGFDRWLQANVAIGSLFAATLLGMAFLGSDASLTSAAAAKTAQATEISAAPARSDAISPYEMMTRYAPDALPVERVENPF